MRNDLIVVDGCVPTSADTTNLRDDAWSIALDQRAFGPRRLLVAFADEDGRFRGLAFTDRTEPLELAFEACLIYLGDGAAAAIAYCDEPVQYGPPPAEFIERLERMRALAGSRGIRLVDWIACDDRLFRSSVLSLDRGGNWWDGV